MRALSLVILLNLFPSFAIAASVGFEKVVLTTGNPEICAEVLRQIETTKVLLSPLPASVEANESLNFDLGLEKDYELSSEKWNLEYSTINSGLSASTPYPNSLGFEITSELMSFFFSPGIRSHLPISIKIPANLSGTYDLQMTFAFVTQELKYCVLKAFTGRKIKIDSPTPDVTPPLVEDISFDKVSYKPGDEVVVKFKLSEKLLLPQTDHIEFTSSFGGGFPGYLSDGYFPLSDLGEGSYQLKFTIPKETPPGTYPLKWFNRRDSFMNFESGVGSVDLAERQVSNDKPLLIN